ncbi:hypothetical protein [Nocardia terpenica]|uniref:HTH cro/C1-type domain-containing protein n=1 Tax=Nocardia terpenica TaxID=455432 RepID=A0A164I1E0_9NOCA|nr:hypothetical protein [Nocardia terpenica]KZM69010.1 hypothetical protein AWN90_14805 [Nocardia terpenica]NQE87900.1 hypothetical protein [Nocardia terpenica]
MGEEPAARHGARPLVQQMDRRLTELIAARYPDQRKRPGYGRMASEIREATGGAISGTYLWELATGKKRNPTMEQLDILSAFFGVRPEYFFTDEGAGIRAAPGSPADPETEDAALLRRRLAEQDVRTIAMRAGAMSPALRRQLLQMMDILDPTPPRDEGRR